MALIQQAVYPADLLQAQTLRRPVISRGAPRLVFNTDTRQPGKARQGKALPPSMGQNARRGAAVNTTE